MEPQSTYLGMYFPWSLLLALLVAILFAAIGIIIFRRGMSKASKPAEPSEDMSALSPWRNAIRDFLARYGYMPTDPLSRSFVRALRVIHSFLGGHEFRYQLPWYLVIGASDSGKSSMLNSLDLNLPVGRPHFGETGDEGEKVDCDWWFYDHGIVLDVAGRMVIESKKITSDERKWDTFLDLLAHHRPKRPLDGLVLAIPCDELVGEGALSYDELRLRAEYIYMKMWQLQKKTGLRLPVYIAVTKCDKIPGFQNFCTALPKGRDTEIFGWSNESALDTTYEPQWVSDAFNTIRLSLYRIQQNIFAGGKVYTNLDGIFQFPFAFSSMEENLELYVNHIFKTSGYHEGFFLRGIYFTGDSGAGRAGSADLVRSEKRERELETLVGVQEDIFGDAAEKPTEASGDLLNSVYFVNDLFEKRVFREMGIARPVSTLLLGNTSAMRVAKIGVASGTVVATLGLLNAAENLGRSRASLEPSLIQINETLSAIQGKNLTNESGQLFFQQQAENLLETMDQLQANNLTSFFIPASWFSRINDNLTDVMAVAFNEVIFASMARELVIKADNLVSLATIIEVDETPEHDGDPLKTVEFYRLRNYVYQVHALALTADRFNNIGITADLQDVAGIIYYLFNMRMPEAFYTNSDYYQRALKYTKVKVFDFGTYQHQAIEKLRKLYDEFQLVAFNSNVVIPGLEELREGLEAMEHTRNVSTFDMDNLRKLSDALTKTINTINSPHVQWIDVDHFSPGIGYEHVMSTISASQLLGADVTSQLTEETEKNFSNFKKDLEAIRSPLLGGSLFQHEGNKLIAKPSVGATKLQGLLSLFYSEQFMREAKKTAVITQVPEGSVLMWDSLRLSQAADIISSFSTFVNAKLLTFPKSLQPLLQKVAAESLVANITELVSDAEVFTTQEAPSYSMSPEDALLSQVQNYRATSENLNKILFTLQANSGNTAYSNLRHLVTEQYYGLLTRLNNILEEDKPYAIKDGDFSWWDGENQAAQEAFGVSSLPELKGYLELQRERIRYLAMEFAAPVVSFLSNLNKQGMPGNLPLVSKWQDIISELQGYDKKVKGNGLSTLEDYIETTLNRVTLGTCGELASSVHPLTLQNSYFITIMDNIQLKLSKQCKALAGAASTTSYSQLSDYFNSNLAGRYPFVTDEQMAAGDVLDVSPDDLKAFFELMDDQASSIKDNLKQASAQLGSAGKRAEEFIDQVDQVREFFGGFLVKDSKMPEPQFDFSVDFRVNRHAEKAGNQIVDWFVNVQDTEIDFRSKDRSGHWNLGDPISVGFRWAANSPEQPQLGGDNPALSVFNGTASFSYGGKWGLVKLLKSQAAPLSDFQSLKDKQPETLAFEIPLKDLLSTGSPCPEAAKVFVRFEIKPIQQDVDKKTGAVSYKPGKVVTLPTFPASAPKLSGV